MQIQKPTDLDLHCLQIRIYPGSAGQVLIHWTDTFPVKGLSDLILSLPCFIEIPVLNAISVDTNQTPRSAASVLCFHCLSVPLVWKARHKWVNGSTAIYSGQFSPSM